MRRPAVDERAFVDVVADSLTIKVYVGVFASERRTASEASSTFFARVNFADQMLFPNGRPIPVPALIGAATTEEMVNIALQRLVDGNVPPESRDALISFASSISRTEERAATVAYLVLSSPEYQLA